MTQRQEDPIWRTPGQNIGQTVAPGFRAPRSGARAQEIPVYDQ